MSYAGISVREAMEKLNTLNNGWYLPYIQRQYVWGDRDKSEEYVCLLLDSLKKGYPIGGLVIWETTTPVCREFLNEYEPRKFSKQIDRPGHKFLVYDGQQRLQTLRSVLYYAFNGRVLHFNLLFNEQQEYPDETGFVFRDKGEPPHPQYLKLTELVSTRCDTHHKVELEDRLLESLRQAQPVDRPTELLIKENLVNLWDIFVDTNKLSIAYFSVKGNDETVVNEVFRRLNTGGIALTQVELVLGEIKKRDPIYEEKLWELSERIEKKSHIKFAIAQILQFFHLVEKGTSRIDASLLSRDGADADRLQAALAHQDALIELFEGYLWGLFKINHASIVPRWVAVLPLAVYFTALKRAGREWRVRALTSDQVSAMNTYLLLAQFCDWNTQTMVNAFAKLADEAGGAGAAFPTEAIRQIAVQKNRTGVLSYQQFVANPWFALKVLTPGREYIFHENKPQVDHIFPLALEGGDTDYKELVDILWNFQPIQAGINNYKRARHPKEFFNSKDGEKYWKEYDFIPRPESSMWDDAAHFIQYREEQMRHVLFERYGLRLSHIGEHSRSAN